MRRFPHLIILFCLSFAAQAQHTFKSASLSDALIELDQSSRHYDISFVYDELEDFTVSKTIKRGRSLPDAVREVCGFYPVRVSVKGRDILVECIQKDRTKLIGRLVGPDRQPVAYANITLFNPSDSSYTGGGVSNEAGDFVIPCGAERARVRISCVGFKTIEREMPIKDAGTIRMQMENNYLDNVTVSGRMPVIRSQSDRLQYIVSNDAFARGLNAQELLSRVPMVSMSDGHAMILGKGPARFMLNGRITEMGDEVIQQKLWTMRSEDIERIEVISIPSGRDMMEMGGGYINIVLRRDQALGWRGDVSAEAGVSDDWSERGSGSVSYASEKFDMTIDAHGGRITQTTDDLMTYRVHSNNSNDIFSDTRTKHTDKELTTNVNFRYQPVNGLELGGMLSWHSLWSDKKANGDIFNNTETIARSGVEQAPDGRNGSLSLTAYLDWRLDKKGKLLSLTYNNYKKDDGNRTQVWCNDINNPHFFQNVQEDFFCEADYHIQSYRIDLTLPSPLLTLDAGLNYTDIRNQALPKRGKDIAYAIYIGETHRFYDFQEKTKAAYISLHKDWKRLSIKAGLRYEHIGLDGKTEYQSIYDPNQIGITYFGQFPSRNYWQPSLSASFRPQEGHQLSLVWGTSCIRPNFYDLTPLYNYKSGYEVSEGNPNICPSRVSSVELSYHNHQGLYACAYYHHASDVLTRMTTLSAYYKTDEGITSFNGVRTTPLNYGKVNQYGLYLRYQYPLTKDLQTIVEGEAYYNDQKIKYPWDIEDTFSGKGQRLALSADWYMNRQHNLLLNARYQHCFSDYVALVKTDSYGYFTFALRYSLMDDRLKLSLVVKDPFRQHITNKTLFCTYEYGVIHLDREALMPYSIFSHTNHHTHYIGLSATYSFGSKKVRRIQHDLKDTESQRAQRQK